MDEKGRIEEDGESKSIEGKGSKRLKEEKKRVQAEGSAGGEAWAVGGRKRHSGECPTWASEADAMGTKAEAGEPNLAGLEPPDRERISLPCADLRGMTRGRERGVEGEGEVEGWRGRELKKSGQGIELGKELVGDVPKFVGE